MFLGLLRQRVSGSEGRVPHPRAVGRTYLNLVTVTGLDPLYGRRCGPSYDQPIGFARKFHERGCSGFCDIAHSIVVLTFESHQSHSRVWGISEVFTL